jgi:glycosyl transferase family 25
LTQDARRSTGRCRRTAGGPAAPRYHRSPVEREPRPCLAAVDAAPSLPTGKMNNLFDAVYIINLPARTDRRREMIEQLALAGIESSDPGVIFFDAVRPTDAGGFPTIGTRGCFMSHVGVLKSALAAGHRRILILEDDANFIKDFQAEFAKLAPRLAQPDWGMAYLGALAVEPPIDAPAAVTMLPPSTSVMGTHMFAVQSTVVRDAIDYFEAMLKRAPGDPAGGPMHVDGAYSWFRKSHPDIATLLCSPPLGYQRPSRTDVHAMKWFDRLPVVRAVVQELRKARAAAR